MPPTIETTAVRPFRVDQVARIRRARHASDNPDVLLACWRIERAAATGGKVAIADLVRLDEYEQELLGDPTDTFAAPDAP